MRYKLDYTEFSIPIEDKVISDIKHTVGEFEVETGAVLFARNGKIVEVVFDEGGTCSHGAYDPDYKGLNKILKVKEAEGLEYVGSVHSHPRGVRYPSEDWGNNIGDHGAIKANLACNPNLDKFIAIIVYSTFDGGDFEIFPFVVFREEQQIIYEAKLDVIKDISEKTTKENEFTFNVDRLEGGVDTALMKDSKIVCIGVGGANEIVEKMARTNVHNLVCIDYDIVDENNLVTQGYFRDDIGKPKVVALGERLKRINPTVNYEGINANLFDLPDKELKRILSNADLLLMMTDSFEAQVKGNQLSIQYGIPAIFALMYYKGVACEITWNIPDLFSLSHKDAVIERYAANFEKSCEQVTSTGGTIFQTGYLNNAIGILALHILHRHLSENHYGGVFEKGFNRNFIQLRLNKGYSAKPGNMFFEAGKSNKGVNFFDAIWREVLPATENPEVDLVGKDWFSLS